MTNRDLVIRVEELSKRYRLGMIGGTTLADDLKRLAARIRGLPDPTLRIDQQAVAGVHGQYVWALEGVSFDVHRGEVVGVIGANGAGKSTLLKLLTNIMAPTRGCARIFGRVGSLLEVGTGFHPELTGRDNIFLNGAILGMRHDEVASKLEEIIDFSGVGKYIDTPVKRYSSGMYVRLAFAVAAHLEPEILIVDEVLAVGDAAFQRKCLGKMKSVSQAGRTVLFVSHNMDAISRLCDRCLLLSGGRLVDDGPAERIVAEYLRLGAGKGPEAAWPDTENAPGDESARLRALRVVDREGKTTDRVGLRDEVGVEIVVEVLPGAASLIPMLALYDERGHLIFNSMSTEQEWQSPRPSGLYRSRCRIPGDLLNEGVITVSAFVNELAPRKVTRHAQAPEAVAFRVQDQGQPGSAKGLYTGQWGGVVMPLLDWRSEPLAAEVLP